MEKKKILLVDDASMFIELERLLLRSHKGLEIITARNGQEGFKKTVAERPDVVFMDLNMPGLNGDESCRLIKNHPAARRTPVVMVTTGGRQEDLDRCRAAGCNDILLKPVNRSEFLEKVRKHLYVSSQPNERVPAKLFVHHRRLGSSESLTNFSVNLSTGGLFLETGNPLPVDTLLSLEFCLPGQNEKIGCNARVAWVNDPGNPCKQELPAGMGLQLLDLQLAQMEMIRSFVLAKRIASAW